MDSREQFEAWLRSTGQNPPYATKRGYWEIWQASRAALVIDIDSHTEFEIEHIISPEQEGYPVGWIDGRNYAANQVRKAGISIKGD